MSAAGGAHAPPPSRSASGVLSKTELDSHGRSRAVASGPELGSVTSGVTAGQHRIGWAASVLQASGFRADVAVFRRNAQPRPKTGPERAFRRNTAERVHLIEAAHNPEVAGSNPAPATGGAPETGPFRFPQATLRAETLAQLLPFRRSGDSALGYPSLLAARARVSKGCERGLSPRSSPPRSRRIRLPLRLGFGRPSRWR